jgi:NAD(P)-dependent dehydrogenase (short-subunit alcohol dehydrogenase family)
MSFQIDLEGRRALVTGAGRGIGRAIACTLAEAGAVVAVNDIVAAQAEDVVAEITASGGDADTVPFDVTDYSRVVEAIDRLGQVDILVNNAGNAGEEGFGRFCNFAESEPDEWTRFFAVNVFGTMNCTRAALPSMITSGWGRVLTIVSDAARFGGAQLAPYSAAKAGAAGFSRSVAREVGRHGITVNCVSLGTIETPTTARPPAATPEEEEARRRRMSGYVIRRRGTPEDVTGLVTFLASPLASWITGQTYAINGGYLFSL